MIEIDEKTFRSAFENADVKTKELMGYTKIHDCLTTSLPPTTEPTEVTSFVALIGYHILGIIDNNKIVAEFTSLGIQDPQTVLSKIMTCVNNTKILPEETEVSDNLTTDIAETEATLKAIPHVRTMAEDMRQSQATRETTYSSTQEAILKEGRSNSDKTSPQWGSVN